MNRIVTVGILLFLFSNVHAQILPEGGGARAAALGQAYTAVQGDLWGGMFFNPASLVGMESTAFGADAERRFGLSELLIARAGAALPWGEEGSEQAIGIGLTSFGFENYNAYRISAGYAISAFEVLQLGARIHYQGINVTGYGSGGAFVADFGFIANLNDEISLAGRAHNINQARMRTNVGEDILSSTLAIGMGYRPNSKVLLAVDVEKSEFSNASLRFGAEYKLHTAFTARVGTHTQPLGWSGGFSVHTGPLNLDIAGRYHERLGFFPQLSLSWNLNNASDEE